MSLKPLFEDRKVRKYIRDSINEAAEIGKGSCDCCDERKSLLSVFGKHLCEDCATKAFEISENYDVQYNSISDNEIIDYIKEGYIIPNIKKLEADANAKFGGSIPELMKSYGLSVHKEWNDRYSQGKIFIKRGDHTSGKTRLNQFMIDYDCEFCSVSVAQQHVADADGTMVDIKVNGQPLSVASQGVAAKAPKVPSNLAKATTNRATKQSSSGSVQLAAGYVGGNYDRFQVQLGDSEEIDVVRSEDNGNDVYTVSYRGESVVYTASGSLGSIQKAVEFVKDEILKNPKALFSAFSGNSSGEFEINKYSIYKFKLDKYSFGKQLTLCPVYKGKEATKQRVPVVAKALSNISVMNAELTKYLDAMVEKNYPALSSGKNKLKTSIGTATFELESIDPETKIVTVLVDIANSTIGARIHGEKLKDAKESKDAFAEVILNALYNTSTSPIKGKKLLVGTEPGKDSYQYDTDLDGKKYTVYGKIDWKKLYNTGDIVIGISVIDDHTGEEQPKSYYEYIVRKPGLNIIDDILKIEGEKIYKKYFIDSNAESKMTDSALNKMKSPSKKAAFLDKLSAIFVKNAIQKGMARELREIEVEIDMKVNKDGKPIEVTIMATDPYSEFSNDSKALSGLLGLDKLSFVKVKKIDTDMKDGPSVIYSVTDMKDFSQFVDLSILESEIFDAFDLTMISESGRKVFHV